MKTTLKVSGISIITIFIFYLSWFASHGQAISPAQNIPAQFKGAFLAASDADMLGGAYANGVLNKVEGIEDSLTLIEVVDGKPRIIAQQFASNSVISWPSIIAVSPDQKYAYVAETRAVYKGESNTVKDVWADIPTGKKVSVFDLRDPKNPVLLQEKELGEQIGGVSINKAGTLLVASSTVSGKELTISRLKNGKIGQTTSFKVNSVEQSKNKNRGIRTLEFHPTQNVIAANLDDKSILFYRINDDDSTISVEQIGEPLKAAKHWSVGNWHPNGKYFILSDVAWGDGTIGFLFHGKGKLVSVQFDEQGKHEIVSKVKVGLSPEGADLSPDGNYAVTVNMRKTWAPTKGFWFVPAKKYASLSLIKVDPTTGKLIKLGKDYGFKGALPEDAIFDQESNSLAVTIYHDRSEVEPTQGWIDFWEIRDEELVFTGTQLKLTRGVHNLLLLK